MDVAEFFSLTELTNVYTVVCLGALLWMGMLGFLDDYLKVVRGRTEGLVARYKMVGQWVFGIGLGLFLISFPVWPIPANWTSLPFFADWVAVFWMPVYVVFVGAVVAELVVLLFHVLTELGYVDLAYLWYNVIGCVLVFVVAFAVQPFVRATRPAV